MSSVTIEVERPDQPDVVALIEALDAYQKPLCPPESHHGVDITTLMRPEVVFLVARDAGGKAVGCGAVMLAPDHGELKRMFVHPDSRGRGIARQVLARLEAEALRRGRTCLMLETGPLQHEAIALYERSGFCRRGPFGDYWDDPWSVFMEKALASSAG